MITRLDRFLNRWRLWFFRGFAAIALAAIPLSHIQSLQNAFSAWHVFEGLIVVLLVMTVETILHAVARLPSLEADMRVVPTSESIHELIRTLKEARSLDIICSSSESFFLGIAAIPGIRTRELTVRILMRMPPVADLKRQLKLESYKEKWLQLAGPDSKGLKVEVRYHSNDSFRAFLLDDQVALVGFFVWSEERQQYLGDTVPLIRADTQSPVGNTLLRVYRNRFDRLWATSQSQLPTGISQQS